MNTGIGSFVFPAPLSGEITIARLAVNTANRLGWELVAVFNEQRGTEIQAFGIFRRSTEAALQAALGSLEEKQKALEAKAAAVNEALSIRAMLDARIKELEQHLTAETARHAKGAVELTELRSLHAQLQYEVKGLRDAHKEREAALAQHGDLLERMRELEKQRDLHLEEIQKQRETTAKVNALGLEYCTQLNTLKLEHKALKEKYVGYILETARQIKLLKKELRATEKPVMKEPGKTPEKPFRKTLRKRQKHQKK